MGVLESFKLDGKVALVTGSAGLFGRQIARVLCEAGARVFTASRSIEGLRRQEQEMKKEGLTVEPLHLDQEIEHSVLLALKTIVERRARWTCW